MTGPGPWHEFSYPLLGEVFPMSQNDHKLKREKRKSEYSQEY